MPTLTDRVRAALHWTVEGYDLSPWGDVPAVPHGRHEMERRVGAGGRVADHPKRSRTKG
jgi:hypothetical protein